MQPRELAETGCYAKPTAGYPSVQRLVAQALGLFRQGRVFRISIFHLRHHTAATARVAKQGGEFVTGALNSS